MKNKKKSLRRQGFTIVELLVYCGILTIFLYIMTSIFTSVLDMQLESESTSAVVSDGQYLFARLAYDIGRATSIVQPPALGAETSSLVIHIGASDYTYTVNDGDLTLTSPSGAGVLNGYGSKISNISFRRYGNIDGKHSVRIFFTLTSTTQRPSGPEVRDFETTIGLR